MSSCSRLFLGAAAGALLIGCGDSGELVDTASECNPLGGAECVTPWPSSIYEVDDSTAATGVRLDFPDGALPSNEDGIPIDPAQFNRRDGFSPAVQIFTAFPGGVDPSNLVGHRNMAASLTDASPTVLIDLSTGDRVAHFAEIDANEQYDPDIQALYIRPASRLKGATRYAVGLRTSLLSKQGGTVPMPAGFQAILDGASTGHERLERIRPRYDEIFAAFEAQGISPDDLVLAWDFTTASDEFLQKDLTAVRDRALGIVSERANDLGFDVLIDEPYEDGSQIARIVRGTFDAPMFLTGKAADDGIDRDAARFPVPQGTTKPEFVGLVPACASSDAPVPIVIFGHGFFGSNKEAQDDHVRRFAEEACVVVLGTEWVGMRMSDVADAALALNNLNNLPFFSDRIMQGMANFHTLAQLAHTRLASELLVDEGGPVVDPERIYFYGISQGSILGSTFVARDPLVTRAILHNGGANWSLLFERSGHWAVYGTMVRGAYPGALRMVLMMGLLQMGFDYTDPINVAPGFFDHPISGTPPKQVLLHMSVGDIAVTNLASMHQARTLGVPVLSPSVFVPYGMEERAGPLDSGLVIWDEHPEPMPHESNLLNERDNGTHSSVRNRDKVLQQMALFLNTGEIVHTCGEGPCDCSTGACDD